MNTTRICPELLENWFGKDAAKQIAEVSHQSGVYFHPQHGCCKAYFCGSCLFHARQGRAAPDRNIRTKLT